MGACADSDGDGVNDCEDGCPDDPAKSEAGVCGCNAPEVPRCGQPPPEDVAYAGGSAIGLALDCSGALTEAEFAITIRQVPPSDSARMLCRHLDRRHGIGRRSEMRHSQ